MGKVKKYALMGAGMFVFSFILGGVILPTVVKMEVKKVGLDFFFFFNFSLSSQRIFFRV